MVQLYIYIYYILYIIYSLDPPYLSINPEFIVWKIWIGVNMLKACLPKWHNWHIDNAGRYYNIFTVGEAVRSTCGNSQEKKEEEEDCFHLSLHQTIWWPNSKYDQALSWRESSLLFAETLFPSRDNSLDWRAEFSAEFSSSEYGSEPIYMVCNQIFGMWPNIWYMAMYMAKNLPYPYLYI